MDREALKARLVVEEGLRLRPYADSLGKITIGVGRNLSDVGISHDEAMALLDNDIASVEADLDRALPWWRSLDDVRQSVLADMCFNMGLKTLLTFRHTLADIQGGHYLDAATGMRQSLWRAQVGGRAERLAHAMEHGAFSST
jgi:lysozyme